MRGEWEGTQGIQVGLFRGMAGIRNCFLFRRQALSMEDYRDFLRTRGIEEWSRDHACTKRLRELNRRPNPTYKRSARALNIRTRRSQQM